MPDNSDILTSCGSASSVETADYTEITRPKSTGKITFLKEFIRSPKNIGAIAPSSMKLAQAIVKHSGAAQAANILEFGAGTGVFTQVILREKKPDANFIAIEHNDSLSEMLRQHFPDTAIVTDSVENVSQIMQQHNMAKSDCIVCGLPWTAFSQDMQNRLIMSAISALAPGGTFATFAYWPLLFLPAGMRFRKILYNLFSHVEISPIVWKNLPPAIVYRCIR
ncbi:MAG: methyltransferase domain-containing protein [Sedimentisphaerales bacterium]|nr:methyltransferase domain-containing protein [Sedimentisphaerales bacterium]